MSLLFALLLSVFPFPLAPSSSVGRIHFPVSCNAAAQRSFTRGVLALHSFWYEEARKQFQSAERADPRCAMAYWGEAMSHVQLLWMGDDTAQARAALARIPAPPPTARERAWLSALTPLVSTDDPWPRRAAFAAAMERVEQDFPDDESKSFLALALLTATENFDLARYVRAGALAMEVTAHNPDHPGALHYTIHAFDTPELAPLALPAAERYAKVAPAAPHALHMPAHIFARLGMWPEALASCESAWRASEAWVKRDKLPLDARDFHSFGWIIAIHATIGQPHAAEVALHTLAQAADSPRLRDSYVSRAILLMRATGDWSRIDALLAPIHPSLAAPPAQLSKPACHAPSLPSMQWLAIDWASAHIEAAAAKHDLATVDRLIAERSELRKQIATQEAQLLGTAHYARQQQLDRLEDQALHAEAARDPRTAALRWQAAAALEDADPPDEGADGLGGDHARAGEDFLQAQDPTSAQAELERSRARYPGWPATWAALGRVAVERGDHEAARHDFARAAELWAHAESDFAPAQAVRAELAKLQE